MDFDIAAYLPPSQQQLGQLLHAPVAPDAAQLRARENRIIKRELTEDELTEHAGKRRKRKSGDSGKISRAHTLKQWRYHNFDPHLTRFMNQMSELRRVAAAPAVPHLVEFLLVLRRFGMGRALHHLQLAGATTHLQSHLQTFDQLGLLPHGVITKLGQLVEQQPNRPQRTAPVVAARSLHLRRG